MATPNQVSVNPKSAPRELPKGRSSQSNIGLVTDWRTTQEQIRQLREALRFYADQGKYEPREPDRFHTAPVFADHGRLAQQALAQKP